ncbi:MAG: hypothetical protein JWR20_827 [Marmoricola sp.]|nr:hypothetical protein [Marmoricola sp.]
MTDSPLLHVRGRALVVDRPLIMGVVNASPDSFSDPGHSNSLTQQIALCSAMIEAGADIIDVGGQSSITNRPEVDPAVEVRLVLPIVQWLVQQHPDVLVSVDTYKPEVAHATLDAGAAIINDVSGLMHTSVAKDCAAHDAALVVMHTRARPKVRLQHQDLYADVVDDVVAFLDDGIARAVGEGLSRDSIILDPGPDFTKTPHQTVELLRHIHTIQDFARPVLLALSRKDFLGAITGRSPRGREAATHAAFAHFAAQPGYILRVHDVAAAKDVIDVVDVLSGRRDLDPAYLLPDAIRHEPAT